MNWILVAYLAALVFLSVKTSDGAKLASLRTAWITFALIPLSEFLMHLLQAGNFGDSRSIALIGIWSLALPSLLLGISFLFLTGVIAPARDEGTPSE